MKFSVAKDFSRFPAGRVKADGKFSGEAFRILFRECLVHYPEVLVDLDGTKGYGSSWLEEAFGGLVSHDVFTASDLHDCLKFTAQDTSLITEIWAYIDSAKKEVT